MLFASSGVFQRSLSFLWLVKLYFALIDIRIDVIVIRVGAGVYNFPARAGGVVIPMSDELLLLLLLLLMQGLVSIVSLARLKNIDLLLRRSLWRLQLRVRQGLRGLQ